MTTSLIQKLEYLIDSFQQDEEASSEFARGFQMGRLSMLHAIVDEMIESDTKDIQEAGVNARDN